MANGICFVLLWSYSHSLCILIRVNSLAWRTSTVYPKKYAHGFVVLCFVVVIQSFIMNSHEVFIHIHQGCFAGTGAIVRLPQCQWNKPDGYGKISQCINTTKHSKAKTLCIFLGIYCICQFNLSEITLNVVGNISNYLTITKHHRMCPERRVQKSPKYSLTSVKRPSHRVNQCIPRSLLIAPYAVSVENVTNTSLKTWITSPMYKP